MILAKKIHKKSTHLDHSYLKYTLVKSSCLKNQLLKSSQFARFAYLKRNIVFQCLFQSLITIHSKSSKYRFLTEKNDETF